MSKMYKFAAALSLFVSIALIAACSSSTSSSGGSGQIPTGQYVGNLNGQTSTTPASVTSTRILMDLTTEITSTDGASTLSEPFASISVIGGTRCFSSATTSGGTSSVNGDRLQLGMTTDQRGALRLTGRFNDDTYTGTFTLSNSTSPGCIGPISGGFDLERN